MHVYPVRIRPLRDASKSEADRSALAPVIEKLKKGEPVTIVCWGDSVTACGEASSPGTCYVGALEMLLRDRFGRKTQVQVINAGIGGTSTPGRLPAFQKEVLEHKPDVVTLEFVNDMGVPIEQLKQLYADILSRTKAAGAVLVIITPHWTMPEWMGLPKSGLGKDTRPAVAFLRQFARENHVPLADASARWEQLQYEGVPYETLLKNGINHPDDRGHAIFAQELWNLFR